MRVRLLPIHGRPFGVGDARALGLDDASRDAVFSGLVLNSVPDRETAFGEMHRVLRPGCRLGFYAWDYSGGGLGFLRRSWDEEAAALDSDAEALAEARRFAFFTPEGLTTLTRQAGFAAVACAPIEIETALASFDDFWLPFTLGAGPAPGYCASLAPEARERLRQRLEAVLPFAEHGTMRLTARAWAVRGEKS